MPGQSNLSVAEKNLAGSGEIGELMRALDWSRTSLGAVETWPPSLLAAIGICLRSEFLTVLWWGKDFTAIYDVSRLSAMPVHGSLGKPGSEIWPEIWGVIGPMIERTMSTGEPAWSDDVPLFLEGDGYSEESYFRFSYSPMREEAGAVAGVFTTLQETTARVIADRRLRTLSELAGLGAESTDAAAASRIAAGVMSKNSLDIPFVAIYLAGDEGLSEPSLAGWAGISADEFAGISLPSTLPAEAVVLPVTGLHLAGDRRGPAANPWVEEAIYLPICRSDSGLFRGYLVAGINPYKRLDRDYRTFFELLARQVSAVVESGAVRKVSSSAEHGSSEQKLAEDALRASEIRFRTMADAAPVLIWVAGTDKLCYWFNKVWLEFTGRSMEQEYGNGWAEGVHAEDFDQCLKTYIEAFDARESFRMEYRLRRHDGEYRWLLDSGVPRYSSEGLFDGYIGSCIDIDDHKRIESAMRESEERFRTLADGIDQLAWISDPAGQIFWFNRRWYEYTGSIANDMSGGQWQSVHDAAMLPQVLERWEHCLLSGEPFDMEFPLRGADGNFRWFLTRAAPVRDETGKITRWFGTNTDVEELRHVREALRQSESQFRQLADAMPQLVWINDADGVFAYFNRRWVSYTGISVDEAQNEGWMRALHPDDTARCTEEWQRSLKTGQPYEIEYRLRAAKDGNYRWFLGRGTAVYDHRGEIVQWFGTCTDINDQKETENELRRANEDLNYFAFAASHDLQEPLRMITSYTQMLVKDLPGPLDPDAPLFVTYIVEGTQRMRELLSDLLTYTSVGSERDQPLELVDLNVVLRKTCGNLSAVMENSHASIGADTLPAVRGHEVHYVQLFQNLIENAIKYRGAKPPLIQIRASRGDKEWTISVEDNGLGIATVYHQKIFGVFKRLHGRTIPGTGIGLAICQKVVERYGGTIWVASELENGSTFYFTVPIAMDSDSTLNESQARGTS